MIRVGVIGYGYWGPNILRNLAGHRDLEVSVLAESRQSRLAAAATRYRAIELTTNAEDVLNDPKVDAVAIATPPGTHAPFAIAALEQNKHVLLAKPLASNVHDARRVADAASRSAGVLVVDNTYVYTGAVRKLRELVDAGELGTPRYYDSMRVNLGIYQPDVSVVWDLAPHDLAILDHLFREQPVEVTATSHRIYGARADIARIVVGYDSGFTAHMNLSWASPVKIRLVVIGGTRRFALYDDTNAAEKVKVYDASVQRPETDEAVYQALVQPRVGDVYAPKLDQTEALEVEVAHFVACIQGHDRPITDAAAGYRSVLVLDAVEQSLATGGRVAVARPA